MIMALRGTRRARSANRVSDWFREAGVIGSKLCLLTITVIISTYSVSPEQSLPFGTECYCLALRMCAHSRGCICRVCALNERRRFTTPSALDTQLQ